MDQANATADRYFNELATARRTEERSVALVKAGNAREVFKRAARIMLLNEADRNRLLDFSRYVQISSHVMTITTNHHNPYISQTMQPEKTTLLC